MASKLAIRPASYATEANETSVSRAAQAHEKYERLIARTKDIPAILAAVVWPCEEHALAGAIDAAAEEIIAPILVGPEKRIRAVAQKAGLNISSCTIVDVATEEEAAATAVRLVRDDKAQSLMKGRLHTDVLMHQVVAKDSGLRTGRRISHVGGIDGLVFTAGVGEHAAPIRSTIGSRLSWLGVAIDPEANARHGPRISSSRATVACHVIPTNEELMIARHAQALVRRAAAGKYRSNPSQQSQ